MFFPKAMELKETKTGEDFSFRSPVDFPKSEEKEEKHNYTLGIKHERDFPEYFTVAAGGYSFCFQKKVLPSAASDVGNEQKHYDSGYPIIALTEKQAKALWDICGTRDYNQRRRQNHEYTGQNGEREFLPARKINAQEFIDIRKIKDVDPYENPEFSRQEIEAPLDMGEKAKKAVYESQRKNKK